MVIEESPNDLRHLFNHSSHLVQKYKKMSKKWLMTLAHPYTTVRRLWIIIFNCGWREGGREDEWIVYTQFLPVSAVSDGKMFNHF